MAKIDNKYEDLAKPWSASDQQSRYHDLSLPNNPNDQETGQQQLSQGNIFQIQPNKQKQTLIGLMPELRDPKTAGLGAMQAIGLAGSIMQPEIPALMAGAGMIPKAVNAISKMAVPGTFGAMSSPEHPIIGGALGAFANPAISTLGRGFNALRPSNLFRGAQSSQELKDALNITKGTETPLGDVLQSPFLKNIHENVIAKIPFSGAPESMLKTGKDIVSRGETIMSNLLGKNSPANVEGTLNDTLIQANKFHRKLKTELYNDADKIADKVNLKLSLPTFSNLAKEYSSAIESTNILKTEPQFKSLLNKLKNYEEPLEKTESTILSKEGKPIIKETKYPTLKEANILSSHLDDLSERYLASTNTAEKNLGSVFKRLSSSLKNDIRSGIKSSGSKELENSFNMAEKNYAKNYSPFLEKEIYKFANGKADPDMIVQAFIKTGKTTDRANLLEKFVSKMPENKRKLLGYAFLKRAYNNKGEFDPLAFKQLISTKSLGERQFNLLFPGKLGKELKDYSRLIESNPEAFQIMRNPKTGARLGDVAAVAGMIANPFATLGAIGAGRGINKLLTSQKVREKLINKMIK